MVLSNISFSLILAPGVSLVQFEIKTNVRPVKVAVVSIRGMVSEEVCSWELTRNIILRLSVRKARLKICW